MSKQPSKPVRILYGINEIMEATSLGRTMIYEAMRSGELATVRVGRRRLATHDALVAWVAKLTGEDPAEIVDDFGGAS